MVEVYNQEALQFQMAKIVKKEKLRREVIHRR
jgi:hypothetical protein